MGGIVETRANAISNICYGARTPNPRFMRNGGTKVAQCHWGEPPRLEEARKLFQREPDS